jgi:hypothetical protein
VSQNVCSNLLARTLARKTTPLVLFVCLMVFNATFNNISITSWCLVLLVVETGGPGENHRPAASHLQTLSHNYLFLMMNIRVCVSE